MSNIVLNTKTYTGTGLYNGLANWLEQSGGIAASFSRLTQSLVINSMIRVKTKLVMPVVASESSSCSCEGDVIRTADLDASIRMSPGMTLAERTDFADRVKDYFASAQFRAAVITLTNAG